jgi:hypothetical protein
MPFNLTRNFPSGRLILSVATPIKKVLLSGFVGSGFIAVVQFATGSK